MTGQSASLPPVTGSLAQPDWPAPETKIFQLDFVEEFAPWANLTRVERD